MNRHWVEYAAECGCLAAFMLSAAGFAMLFQHPASPVSGSLAVGTHAAWLTRVPMGLAMGLTAMALVYSPAGRRSGAHMNPAVTLAFTLLGRVPWRDAVGYITAQFAGGGAGMAAALWLFGGLPAHPSVNFVATIPGPSGSVGAFLAELLISFVMMTTVLAVSARPSSAPFTGVAAGALVAIFITVEAPYSGMSMNPARSLTANLLAARGGDLWIYFAAPIGGMLAAAALASWLAPTAAGCAKLHHAAGVPCIFCGHEPASVPAAAVTIAHTPSTESHP